MGVWKYFLVGGAAVIGFALAIWSALPIWAEFLVGLSTFALVLLCLGLALAVKRIGGVPPPNPGRSTRAALVLDYDTWHGGTSRGYPTKLGEGIDGVPTWVSVKNTNLAVPQLARGVAARIEFVNDAENTRLVVPEADWYFIRQSRSLRQTAWRRVIDIEGGEDQSFVLFVTDNEGKPCIYKTGASLVGILDDGHWQARLYVSSDNAEGFEGTLGFTLSKHKGLIPDSPAFTMQRRVKPALP